MASLGLKFSSYNFGDAERQEVAVWEWANKPSAGGYWLVYIHGGAWRSKDQTWGDFNSSVKIMADDKFKGRSAIRGFASLDYRLSGPNEQPAPVQHPEHINDIAAGVALLAEKHGLNNDNYILIGQSAGATLAFQLVMGEGATKAPLPSAILGVSGLYDLVGINDRYKDSYASFITPAFGPDKDAWNKASPAKYEGKFTECWPNRKAVVLGNSKTDSLVDMTEMDTMAKRLRSEDIEVTEIKDWDGEHDFIWQNATQITTAVSDLLAKLPTLA